MLDIAYPARVLKKLRAEVFNKATTVVDLGCGSRKFPGAIGVEASSGPLVDVVHDLNNIPYPFETASVDLVIVRHVIEHLDDIPATMKECARILKPGGQVLVLTPHFSDVSSWIDPTHRWHLATRSLEEAGKGALEQKFIYVKLRKFWRRLGVERFVNDGSFQPRVPRGLVRWENDWCYVIRGGEMLCLLEKPEEARR